MGTADAMRLAEKGGIYTKQRAKELAEYVDKWLPGTEFTAGALIEAGKKHAKAIEEGTSTDKLTDDGVFKDLYSSVGIAMVEEVKAKKKALLAIVKKEGDTTDKEVIRQLMLLDAIGELNLKNVRTIAKSPVMVYIYGASIGSIKKKLAYSLGMDTLVNAIVGGSNPELVRMYLDGTEKYVDEKGHKKDVSEMNEAAKWMWLDVNSIIKTMQNDTDATFGKGIETAFENTFEEVNKMRDMTKSVELLTFEVYKAKMATKVDATLATKYADSKNRPTDRSALSKEELADIAVGLIEDGFGHNVTWYKGGSKIHQPLDKTDKSTSQYSTGIGMNENGRHVAKSNSTATIKEGDVVANTGASSTIPIHAIDGNLMLQVLSEAMDGEYVGENVYDAIILAIDKARLDATADSYNKSTIEQGFNRSILVDNFRKLDEMLADKTDENPTGLTTEEKEAVVNALTRDAKNSNYHNDMQRLHLSMNKMIERLEWYKEANKKRVDNSGKDMVVNHSHIAPAKPLETKAGVAKQLGSTTAVEQLLNAVRDLDRSGKGNNIDYVLELNDITKNTRVNSLLYYAEGNWQFKKAATNKLVASDNVLIKGGSKKSLADKTIQKAIEALKEAGTTIITDSKVIAEELGAEKISSTMWKTGKAETKSEDSTIKDKIKAIQDAVNKLPVGLKNKANKIITNNKCN